MSPTDHVPAVSPTCPIFRISSAVSIRVDHLCALPDPDTTAVRGSELSAAPSSLLRVQVRNAGNAVELPTSHA